MSAKIQTSYPFAPAVAMAGMPVTSPDKFDATATCATNVMFGRAVVLTGSTTSNGMTPVVAEVAASTDKFFGVTLIDNTPGIKRTPLNQLDANDVVDNANSALRIRRRGFVWVEVGEAVAIGDAAVVIVATKKFGKTTASNLAINGRFATTAAANGLALLELI